MMGALTAQDTCVQLLTEIEKWLMKVTEQFPKRPKLASQATAYNLSGLRKFLSFLQLPVDNRLKHSFIELTNLRPNLKYIFVRLDWHWKRLDWHNFNLPKSTLETPTAFLLGTQKSNGSHIPVCVRRKYSRDLTKNPKEHNWIYKITPCENITWSASSRVISGWSRTLGSRLLRRAGSDCNSDVTTGRKSRVHDDGTSTQGVSWKVLFMMCLLFFYIRGPRSVLHSKLNSIIP